MKASFAKHCTVKSCRIDLAQQYQLIDRQLTHQDLPSLWVTIGAANITSKYPENSNAITNP